MMAWHAAMAEHRRDELAEFELIDRGWDVHVPRKWQRERVGGKMKLTGELTHAPYFYVCFDGADNEQYDLVLHQRGVKLILESNPGVPAIIHKTVIEDHRKREHAERGKQKLKRMAGRTDLILQARYKILSGAFEGQVGVLFEHHRGTAFLSCNGIKVERPDGDIKLIAGLVAK